MVVDVSICLEPMPVNVSLAGWAKTVIKVSSIATDILVRLKKI